MLIPIRPNPMPEWANPEELVQRELERCQQDKRNARVREVDAMSHGPGVRPVMQGQREPRPIPPNPPRMPEITGVRPLTDCPCGRDLLPGARFCDACGCPVSYTGKTVRL